MTEGFGYMMKTGGLLLGFFFFVVTLSDASTGVRAFQAFLGMGIFALGLVSMYVMKEAKREQGAKASNRTYDLLCLSQFFLCEARERHTHTHTHIHTQVHYEHFFPRERN